MTDQPTPAEALMAVLVAVAARRAQERRIHDSGDAHIADTCSLCQAEAIGQAIAVLGRTVADAFAQLTDALTQTTDESGRPRHAVHGPPQRRPHAPRHHPSNIGLAARSHARGQAYRNTRR